MAATRKLWTIAVVSLVLGCSNDVAAKPEANDKRETPRPVLLVGNKAENTLSFVDLKSGREIARLPTGKMPHEITISADGKRAAVVAYGGTTIDVFDVDRRVKLRTIDLAPNQAPHGIVTLPDRTLLATAERSRSLVVVDPTAGKVVASIATGQNGTHMVVATRDGDRAYTANIPDGTVSVIDLKARHKLRDIAVGGRPEGIALSIDERMLWVGDLEGNKVQAFDTATFEKIGEAATGPVPIRVVASPDGRWIVTSNFEGGTLTLVDAATRQRVRDITLSGSKDAQQVTMLFGPNGRLYVAETGPDTVAEVDLAAGKVLRRFAVGKDGDGLAIAE